MLVLNNTLHVRPVDDIRRCIELATELANITNSMNKTESKQIIVVDYRADSNEPIFDGAFKRIRCAERDDGRGYTITETWH